jgi:hypothetical protein
MNLIIYEWNFKKFTSQDRLQTLFLAGKITRDIVGEKSDNGHIYGHYYKFSTLLGSEIATFYKDNQFGFGTQATGIELTKATVI